MTSSEKILDKLSRLALREVESEELEQPIAASYEELIDRVCEELLQEQSLSESKLRVIRSSLAVLVQRRIGKILEKIVAGEDIPGRLLYKEERKLVELFSKLKIEVLQQLRERRTVEAKVETPREVEKTLIEEVPEESTISKLPEHIKVVQFLEDFPALHSVTLRTFGPFSRFDIAALPADDAEELKRKKVVEYIA